MPPLKLPRLGTIDATNKREFSRYWDKVLSSIEEAFTNIDTLNIEVDGVSATGKFRVRDVAASSGALASIVFETRATDGGSWAAASITISVLTGLLSRIELNADEVLVNGTIWSEGGTLTSMLAEEAATQAGSTEDATETAAAAASAWTLLHSRTITSSGYQVEIDAACDIKTTDANHLYAFAITLDSTDPETSALYNPIVGAGPVFDIGSSGTWRSWSRHVDVTPAAGSHTIRIYGKSDSTAVKFLNKTIRTAEVKR